MSAPPPKWCTSCATLISRGRGVGRRSGDSGNANRELKEARIAYTPRRGEGLRAPPCWAPWLTMEAHRRGVLDTIAAVHARVHPRLSYYRDETRVAMELRCDTVAGRFTHVHADEIEPEAWGFLAEPGAAGLLRTLPEAWRDRALASASVASSTPPRHPSRSSTPAASSGRIRKRLATSASTMDFLLAQDRAAAAKIRQARNWDGRPGYYIDEAGLFELAGHPHIFDEADAPKPIG